MRTVKKLLLCIVSISFVMQMTSCSIKEYILENQTKVETKKTGGDLEDKVPPNEGESG